MSNILLKTAVRTWFTLTSRAQATKRIRSALGDYLALAEKISSETGTQAVTVSRMPGVDEDMRNWSFFMILGGPVEEPPNLTSLRIHLDLSVPTSEN